MEFNTKAFNIITINKENSILWGQKMWFILTDFYSYKQINKLQEHKLWLQNITLAIIYHEFTVSGLEDIEQKVNLEELFDLPEFAWDDTTLAYIAGNEHLGYQYFEDFNKDNRNILLAKLVLKMKNYIFFSFVKHYGGTSSGIFEELIKSISSNELLSKFDEYSANEFVREEFTLFED